MTDDKDIYNVVPTLFMSEAEDNAQGAQAEEPVQEEQEPKPKRKSSVKKRNASKAKEAKKSSSKKKAPAKKKSTAEKKADIGPVAVSDSTNDPVHNGKDDTAEEVESEDRAVETASEEHVATQETTSEGAMEDAPSEDPHDPGEGGEPVIDETEGRMVHAFVGVVPPVTEPEAQESSESASSDTDMEEIDLNDGIEQEIAEAEVESRKPIDYVTDDGEIIKIRPSATRVDDETDDSARICSMCGLPMDDDDKGITDAEGNPICSTCVRGMRLAEREPDEASEEESDEEQEEEPQEEEQREQAVQPPSENSEDAGPEPRPNDVQESSADDVQEKDESEAPEEKGIKGILVKLKKRDAEIRDERKARNNKAKDRSLKKHKKDDDYDPDSISERLRRWYLWRFKGYVKLRTLSRMKNGEYKLETTLVKYRDLPREAVACTGEKGFYCYDTIGNSDWYLQTHVKRGLLEDDFTASDACNYMLTNKIDNALAVNWTEMNHVDFTKIALIAGVVLVVALVIMTRM